MDPTFALQADENAGQPHTLVSCGVECHAPRLPSPTAAKQQSPRAGSSQRPLAGTASTPRMRQSDSQHWGLGHTPSVPPQHVMQGGCRGPRGLRSAAPGPSEVTRTPHSTRTQGGLCPTPQQSHQHCAPFPAAPEAASSTNSQASLTRHKRPEPERARPALVLGQPVRAACPLPSRTAWAEMTTEDGSLGTAWPPGCTGLLCHSARALTTLTPASQEQGREP